MEKWLNNKLKLPENFVENERILENTRDHREEREQGGRNFAPTPTNWENQAKSVQNQRTVKQRTELEKIHRL